MSKFIFRASLGALATLILIGMRNNHETVDVFAGAILGLALLLTMACAYAAGLKKPKRK